MSVNLIGWPYLKAGIGEHMRSVAKALDTALCPYIVIDTLHECFNNMSLFQNDDQSLKSKEANELTYPISIQALNLNHLYRIDKINYSSKYNICYGYYELSELLNKFVEYESYVDEIWAPTGFIQKTLSKKLTVPVVYMPIAIEVEGQRKNNRKKFNLPEKDFIFLTTFDMRSLIERKNPYAVIDSYKEAFTKINANVSLVVKVSMQKTSKEQHDQFELMRTYAKNIRNIFFINDILDRDDILDLMWSCDSYVSLHRAEGLGLGMAESMAMGKPVIGTAYSGNTDFMNQFNSSLVNYELVRDYTCNKIIPDYDGEQKFYWAEADIEHAAECMKKIFSDAKYRRLISENAKKYMKDHHSYNVIGKQYNDRIAVINNIIKSKYL